MFQRNTFVSALLASALALPAFAQDAAAPTAVPAEPEAGAQSTGIEVIEITARKVSENLQETPLAVSAISAELIEGMGISDTQDISALAPNLYLTQTPGSSANLSPAIRGVGSAEPLLTREPGTAVYFDGAYLPRVTGLLMDLIDVERVEVLRGPQGTLYGRNATNGAISFISRKPTEEFDFSSRIGVGGYGRLDFVAKVNTGEVLPGLALSLGFVHSERDGHVNNRLADDNSDPGAKNSDAFRIAARWDATEELSVNYSFDYSNLEGLSPAFQLIVASPTLLGSLAASGINTGNMQISRQRQDDMSLDFDGVSEHTILGHILNVAYDFGPVELKSITTYRKWDNQEVGTELDGNALGTFSNLMSSVFLAPPATSLCGGPGAFPWASCQNAPVGGFPGFRADLFSATNERHQDQWSQELQLIGNVGEQLRYVAGFYYFTEDFTEANSQQLLIATSAATPVVALFPGLVLPNNGFVPFPLPTSPVAFTYSGDARAWALFGNVTYTLPFLEDRLSLTGGIRYSRDEKTFDRTSAPATAGGKHWDNIDWEATVSFLATDDISMYLRGASGYKAGGFNLRDSRAPLPAFDEEKVKSVEVGVKSEFWDNRIRVNMNGFWSIYDDRQTDVFRASASGATSLTINAGSAEIPGLEVELLAIPIDGLTISANVGWIKPKYNEYFVIDSVTSNLVDLADEAEFPYTPEVTTSLGAEYATPPIGPWGWVITPRVDARYTGARLWSSLDDERASNLPVVTAYRDVLKDDGYWLLDARVTISEMAMGERAKVRMAVFGKNITDEEYLLSGIDFGGLGFAGGIFGEPATWGVDFTVDF